MHGAAGTWTGVTGSGANLLALRSHNAALVLDLLRTAGPDGISRLELAERTGLTPQAVSKITARLREAGLAAEAGRRASTGGKPRTVLRLVPEAGHAVGIHLDRDEVRAVLVDLRGTVVGERRAALDLGAGARAVLAAVTGTVRGVVADVLRGAGPESVRETVTEALRDAAAETARETATEALRATGPESVRGTAAEASRGAAAETARETAAEALRATGPESLRETVTESAGEAATEVSRATGPEAVPAAADVLPAGPSLGPGGSLLGVGVALPGPLDHVRGVLHRVTGFPEWDGFPLREALAARLGVPVVVDKDTNAAALGLAAGGESGSFAYLHLGTGLGAGLVIGGSVHRGARTGAGEFGHQVIQLDGPPCTCGDRGCVEALCLGAVARGDVEEAARVLGAGAANLVGLLDIDVVLLGGRTVASAPEAFVRGVGAVLAARARRTGEDAVPVRVAPGGGRVVAAGAAQLVLGPVFGRGVA
ncbi:ROK family transcriptional regulator [Streptomyces sp. HP-A2021]|uniref:ROK family transcriptional regulator n=1 Tax=Streptomyces sp. HP-A2021 TaxID=2927875 RepID=UPI001FAF5FC3|nr:ROK family transcriptional regulator [Streptomyces sp. HP-A2021]UOB15746.1 ROK family transcriptional regulator [Streptomyces sp. HP-A2021]